MVVGISFQSCQMMWLQSSNKRCCETAERRGGSGRFGEEQVGDESEGYGGKWRGCCSWSVKNIWQLWEGWRRLLGFICNAKKKSQRNQDIKLKIKSGKIWEIFSQLLCLCPILSILSVPSVGVLLLYALTCSTAVNPASPPGMAHLVGAGRAAF